MHTPMTSTFQRVSLAAVFGCSICVALSACVPTTPEWESHFGEAARQAVAQQTLNPEASLNTAPVNGVDGPAAKEAICRYRNSFKEPEPSSNGFTIGVGK